MTGRVLVMAKAPVPGRVKTRLCPPWTHEQAARLAAAALADTLDVVTASAATERVLVIDGDYPAPPGWTARPQRGGPLGERLANAFAGAPDVLTGGPAVLTGVPAVPTGGPALLAGAPAVLIGMDTPQLTAALLDQALRALTTADAVFGPAEDGGWWLLGLRREAYADVLRDIPTSTPETGALTLEALRHKGLRVVTMPVLRDVDTAGDALAVAAACPPHSRFARAVAAAG